MNLLKTNLSLFAYDPNKDKNTNYAAQMQAIIDKAGGEKNLTAKDLSSLASLEKAANEKVNYMNQTGTNQWGATTSSKYQNALASMASPAKSSGTKDIAGSGKASSVHYTAPSTTNDLTQAALQVAATPAAYQPIDPSGIDWDDMYLTPSEYKQVQAYGQAYMAAFNQGDMETANYYHDLAERVRANAANGVQYSGGGDGSQFLPFPVEEIPDQEMNKDDIWDWAHQKAGLKPTYSPRDEIAEQNMDTQGRYDYINGLVDDKPAFDSRWDDTKMALANAYLNMNYGDFMNSDQYKALQNRYGLQGKAAAQNILGQIASRTGGLASSYTAQAANQAYNDYMSQLSNAAYDMYRGEANEAYNKAMAAYGYDDSDYGRFLNDLSQWNVEHGYATDAFDKALAQANYNREWDRGLYESDLGQWNRDYGYAVDAYDRGVAQANYNQEWEYKVSQAEKTDAMDRIQSFLSTGGLAANIDPALIRASGYTQAELMQLQNYYQAQLSPVSSGGSSGGGSRSSGSSGGSGNVPTNWDELSAVVGNSLAGSLRRENGNLGGSDKEVISNAYSVYTGAEKKLNKSGVDDALTYLSSRAGSNALFKAYANNLGITDDQINVWLRRKGY